MYATEEARGAALRLDDIAVRRTRAPPPQTDAPGLIVGPGATATLTRARFSENQLMGIVVLGDATGVGSAVLTDVAIEATSGSLDGRSGWGLGVSAGSRVAATRLAVTGAREGGVVVIGHDGQPQTRFEAAHLVVRDTRPAACLDAPVSAVWRCADDAGRGTGGGHALAGAEGAELDLQDFLLTGSALAGLFVASGARVHGTRGRIEGNAIGLVVTGADTDPSRDLPEVFIFDNRTDISRDALVPPRPVDLVLPTTAGDVSPP